jgi:toxin ParE1/3/4
MSRRVRVLPAAEADLTAAADWYESERAGLADELLRDARSAFERLAVGDHGTPVPRAATDARRVALTRFPLWVVFVERDGEVVVVALAHERRRPDFWGARIDRK